MRLVILQTRVIVAINDIFRLKWICYGPERYILDYWGTLIYIFIILLYYINGVPLFCSCGTIASGS